MKIDTTTIEGMIAQTLVEKLGKPDRCEKLYTIQWYIKGKGACHLNGFQMTWGNVVLTATEAGIAILSPQYFVYDFIPMGRRYIKSSQRLCIQPDWCDPKFNPAPVIEKIVKKIGNLRGH